VNELPDLREMLVACEADLAAAHEEGNTAAEANRAAELGDLLYRLGDARGAFDSLVLALQLGAGDDDPADDLALEVAAAQAARRASLFSEAELGFTRALESPLAEQPATRAALIGEHAYTVAIAGDQERAATLFAEAVRTARLADGVEAMVHTLRLRGEAALAGKRGQDAQDAFSRALELAQESDTAINSARADAPEPKDDVVLSVAPAELCAVLLGLYGSGAASDEVLLGALALVPDALAEAESWWMLPRLVPGLLALAETGYLGQASVFEPLRIAAGAALQRKDCAPLHGALLTILAATRQ